MDSKSQDERDKESYERQRVTRACKICQKLHIKCDGKFPCTQCVGKGKSCSYANSATEALLEDRVKSLEVTVKEGTKKNIELEQDNMRLQAEIEQSHQKLEQLLSAARLCISADFWDYIRKYEEFIYFTSGVPVPYSDLVQFIDDTVFSRAMTMNTILAHGALILGHMDKAKQFIDTATALLASNADSMKDKIALGGIHNLGVFHLAIGNFDLVEQYHQRVCDLWKELQTKEQQKPIKRELNSPAQNGSATSSPNGSQSPKDRQAKVTSSPAANSSTALATNGTSGPVTKSATDSYTWFWKRNREGMLEEIETIEAQIDVNYIVAHSFATQILINRNKSTSYLAFLHFGPLLLTSVAGSPFEVFFQLIRYCCEVIYCPSKDMNYQQALGAMRTVIQSALALPNSTIKQTLLIRLYGLMSIMYMKINELDLAEKMANMALEAFDISYSGFFYLLYPIFTLGQLYFVRGRNQQFLHVCEIMKYFAQHFEMAKLCLHQLALYEQGVILPQMSEYHFIHAGASYVQQQNTMGAPPTGQQQPLQQRSLQQPTAGANFGQAQDSVYGYYDKYTPSPVITQYMSGTNQTQQMPAGYNDMIAYQQQQMMLQQQQMQQRGNANVNNNATMQDAYPRNQM
jgi:hypothetical protein